MKTRTSRITGYLAGILALMPLIAAKSLAAGFPPSKTIVWKGELLNTIPGGPCSTNPAEFDSTCPSGVCQCIELEGDTKVSGGFLGVATSVPILDLTEDVDLGVSSSATGSFCRSFFAETTIAGSKDTEAFNLVGVICTPTKNPNAASANETLSGGFSMISSANGHSGFGTFSGTLGFNNNTVKITMKGPQS